jgi:transcriptional regulator with XRE-family HTH domain
MKTIILKPGDKLRILRKAAGMTMMDLALKLHISSRQGISKYETNEKGLKQKKDQLAKIFNVPAEIFIDDSTLKEFILEVLPEKYFQLKKIFELLDETPLFLSIINEIIKKI